MPERFIGRAIGPYLVERLIGGGGSAWVFQARDPALEIDVALKVLKPYLADDPAAVERFRREATTAARLRHPNIVIVRAVGRLDEAIATVPAGTPYLVMDLLPGSLAQRLAGGAPLPEGELLAVGEDVARALAWAHEHGVIHRDVKPDNVLLDRDGRAVVTDFGIARAIAEGLAGSTRSAVVGTPHYFAPEQARGLPLDGRADVYGLGVTLYQAATGELPFAGDDWYTVMRRHVEEPPPPPHTRNPAISAATERLILRALAKAPEDRWPDADAMCRALAATRRALSGEGATVELAPLLLPPDAAVALRAPPSARARAELGGAEPAGAAGTAVATLAPPPREVVARVSDARPPARVGGRLAIEADRRRARTRTWLLGGALIASGAVAAVLWRGTREREAAPIASAPPPADSAPRVDSLPAPPLVAPLDSTLLRADSARLASRASLAVLAPVEANVTVDGRSTRGGWRSDAIAPGTHNVTVEVPSIVGCPTSRLYRVVTLTPGERERLRLTPVPCAEVALDIQPDGAVYTLSRGDTTRFEGRAPLVGALVVPEGTYRVRVNARLCAPYDEEYRFRAGEARQRLRIRLICN